MGEFVERDFHRSRSGEAVNFGSGDDAAEHRRKNRERIEREQGLRSVPRYNQPLETLSPDRFENTQRRLTRGKGRRINPKQP